MAIGMEFRRRSARGHDAKPLVWRTYAQLYLAWQIAPGEASPDRDRLTKAIFIPTVPTHRSPFGVAGRSTRPARAPASRKTKGFSLGGPWRDGPRSGALSKLRREIGCYFHSNADFANFRSRPCHGRVPHDERSHIIVRPDRCAINRRAKLCNTDGKTWSSAILAGSGQRIQVSKSRRAGVPTTEPPRPPPGGREHTGRPVRGRMRGRTARGCIMRQHY